MTMKNNTLETDKYGWYKKLGYTKTSLDVKNSKTE